jgi:hypothetical protein
MIAIVLGLVVSAGLLGCSQTPGDAAYRAGHPDNAAALYKKGAEQGDALAAYKLARLLSAGEVAEEIYGKSGPWDARACELGKIVIGCHNAGVAQETGEDGLAKDHELARRFYLEASERGYAFSQYNLGSMYANQYFRDDKEGYRWMMIAKLSVAKCAAQGNETCQWVLDDPPGHVKNLAERLSQSDREEIEAAAKDWKPVSD